MKTFDVSLDMNISINQTRTLKVRARTENEAMRLAEKRIIKGKTIIWDKGWEVKRVDLDDLSYKTTEVKG